MMSLKKIVGVSLLFFLSLTAYPQKVIRGFVIDSASFAPLSYVNVHIKGTNQGTSSDNKGAFAISVGRRDTLIFSLVGYNSETFSVIELEETVIIRMAIHIKELEGVTIIGRKEKVVRPIHMTPKNGAVNYGPYGAGVNFAYFTKLEKEKRKLTRVKAEWERVKNYVTVVCSPEVKERICKEYSLSDDQYFQILAQFNIENKDGQYDLSSEEWITVLRDYCASHAGR